MGPVSFTYSASVPAAIDNVFALISDPVRMPEWLPRCVAVQATTNHKFPGKGARYTRGRGPLDLVHCERHQDRSAALRRERELKALRRVEKLALFRAGRRRAPA